MKLNLLFLFLFFQALVFSQDSSKYGKFSVSLDYSPTYTYRTVKMGKGKNYGPYRYKTSDQISGKGFHSNLLFGYTIYKGLSVKTGLMVDKYQYNTKILYDTLKDRNNKILSIKQYSLQRNFLLIGIPLKIQETIRLSRFFSFHSSIGINYYFLSSSIFSEDNRLYLSVDEIGLAFLIGVECKFKNLSLTLSPSYNRTLNAFYDETREFENARLYLYSAGVELGINYTFPKKKN